MDAGGIDQGTFHLPVGTATFMLTDVEGSPGVREAASEVRTAAVARQDELVDAAISRHGGVRRRRQDEGISVVAGAQRQKGDYFGQAVNRCAQLRAVAHGGQVVLSRMTRDLVLDRLRDHASSPTSAFIGYARLAIDIPECPSRSSGRALSSPLGKRSDLTATTPRSPPAPRWEPTMPSPTSAARGERKRPSRGWNSLTLTELEVVRQVAAGLTNPQIGQRMFISPGTVKSHLAHIFAKLGTPSRSTWRPTPRDADLTVTTNARTRRQDRARPFASSCHLPITQM